MIQFAPEPGSREAFDTFLRRLLVADWDSADGPMRLSPDLTLPDLAPATFFQNTRLFLAALDEAGGTPTTATGNLNRVFVRQMFDRLILPERFRDITLQVCKVLNEQDVWPLHVVRIVSECAGLVARRNKRFQLTRAGRELRADPYAGALYRKLFLAYFLKFDLHYDFHLRDVPGIQQTMPVILWRLDNVARDWTPVGGLAEQILLPGVLNQLHAAMVSEYDKEEWILDGYVLKPLTDLGLLERKPRSDWPLTEKDHVRTTPLWQKFIHFDHWARGGQ
ncbi:MAG TPA: hypothetical protein PKI20_04355 [Verrucomicrobiota bacterium]|jgi:hypothetical protein|nr:hypothetical protein [Verrucomicrobiota bacterium]HQL76900.1 hypothetical protein [Verrucomicrobiota bacterium]